MLLKNISLFFIETHPLFLVRGIRKVTDLVVWYSWDRYSANPFTDI